MINHPYSTRLEEKSSPSTNKSSTSISMVKGKQENENMARFSIDEHANNLDKNIQINSPDVNIESQTPLHHPSSNQDSHEIIQSLQHEIALLTTELQQNLQPKFNYPINEPIRSNTTNPINSSIQYVLNIDPLQQMKEFVKPFFGNSEEDAIKWVNSVVHFIYIIRLPMKKEDLCFQYAPAFLKANAYRWWNPNKDRISDWSTFIRMFIKQFGEKNEYLLEQQLNQRKKLQHEPLQYYYDMIDLCHKCDPHMSDKQKVRKRILGLRLSLYQEAIKENYSIPQQFLARVEELENIENLVELRLDDSMSKQEIIDQPIPSLMAQSTPYVRYQDSSSYSPSPLSHSNTHPTPPNFPFYPVGHDSPHELQSRSIKQSIQPLKSTPSLQPHNPSRMMNFECYQCGKYGHFARDCP